MKGPLRPRLGPSHLPRCHILVARINHVIGFCKGQTWVSNIISIGIGNPSRKETKTFRSIFLRTQEHSRQSFLESSVLFLVLYIHRMDWIIGCYDTLRMQSTTHDRRNFMTLTSQKDRNLRGFGIGRGWWCIGFIHFVERSAGYHCGLFYCISYGWLMIGYWFGEGGAFNLIWNDWCVIMLLWCGCVIRL